MKNKALGVIPNDKKEWTRRLELAHELHGMTYAQWKKSTIRVFNVRCYMNSFHNGEKIAMMSLVVGHTTNIQTLLEQSPLMAKYDNFEIEIRGTGKKNFELVRSLASRKALLIILTFKLRQINFGDTPAPAPKFTSKIVRLRPTPSGYIVE